MLAAGLTPLRQQCPNLGDGFGVGELRPLTVWVSAHHGAVRLAAIEPGHQALTLEPDGAQALLDGLRREHDDATATLLLRGAAQRFPERGSLAHVRDAARVITADPIGVGIILDPQRRPPIWKIEIEIEHERLCARLRIIGT
jgi:hypothetical protein